MIWFVFLSVINCLIIGNVNGDARIIGAIPVSDPYLLNIFTHEEVEASNSRYSVLVSTLNRSAESSDPAFVLLQPGLDAGNNFTRVQPSMLYSLFHWPKDIAQVPSSVFNVPSIVTSDGSNVTGKNFGAIYLTDVTDINFPSTVDITTGETLEPWSYGKILWKRIDGDIRDDILTCRWQYEADALKFSQLVWLSQPQINPMGSAWDVEVLKESACDINIALLTVEDSSRDEWDILYTAGFHSQKLAFFWAENAVGNPGDWTQPDQVQGAVLELGQEYYDIHVADLNNDGVNEILVTIAGNLQGSVVVYIPPSPDDFRNPLAYTSVVLAANFSSRYAGPLGRSPGVARVFYPTVSQTSKPWILLAGQDDGRGYYLRPISEHPADWTYERVAVVDNGPDQVVSGAAVVDIDGDGFAEAFFSVLTRNVIQVFTFRTDKH